MKITNAEVFLTCPGRNFVILKIETDQGVVGYGDGTLNGREKPVVSYLQDCVITMLIGMDPRRIEDVWQLLYRGAYWRGGPVIMSAISRPSWLRTKPPSSPAPMSTSTAARSFRDRGET